MITPKLQEIASAIASGSAIPYIGPNVLSLEPATCHVPATPEDLVKLLTTKVSVPHKIRNNLTAAAQFIENFKHRKSVVSLMTEAFSPSLTPNILHQFLAGLSKRPLLIVDTWYDDAMGKALSDIASWGQIQGVSQSEHYGTWVNYFDAQGNESSELEADAWSIVLYKPLGSISPAKNFIISDSDFVEVLTEIDIQTPIPPRVKELRVGANFLFIGCRFNNQLARTYARQVMKRSTDKHWAVIEGPLTRMEKKFIEEQNITQINMPLAEFVEWLISNKSQQALAA
ncbi:MAG: SIR2 family protein [Methylotenera sp.]|uniref:SIR2 family NAD-dependent protein deacylase n=1 Tax=Methylotenera sp. TaxID=2051956 RepID=UPI00248A74DD|nr:SIR2 family protein [Methylotenera sp.]MDI1310392.1 SIR2 family protein [Methylotenera sp.]